MKRLLPIALPVAAAFLAYLTGVTRSLGAHPWWADQVIVAGLPVGVALAGLLWLSGYSRPRRLLLFSGLTLAALAIATLAKMRFAASYADDVLAGQFWHVGWIATCAFAAATLASLVWKSRRPH